MGMNPTLRCDGAAELLRELVRPAKATLADNPLVPDQKKSPPAKVDIALLEPFVGLSLDHIMVPSTTHQFELAWREISSCRFIGFDTESKPVFDKGVASSGPAVVQFATATRAFVFQMRRRESHDIVRRVLTARDVVKVGFGLRSDHEEVYRHLGVHVRPVLDLDTVFRHDGYPKNVGVKAAVAIVFNRRLQKSRKATTSNWALRDLQPRQLLYAANDAYAPLRVLEALGLPESKLLAHITVQAPASLATRPEP